MVLKMKIKGIKRMMDGDGRVVIPREVREALNIPTNSALEMEIVGKNILFRKYYPEDNLDRAMNDLVMELNKSEGVIPPNIFQEVQPLIVQALKIIDEYKNTTLKEWKLWGDFIMSGYKNTHLRENLIEFILE